MRDARTTLADSEAILTPRARGGNYFSPGQNASGASPRPTWTSSMIIAGIISTLAFMDSKRKAPPQPESGMARTVAGGAQTSRPQSRGPNTSRRPQAALRARLLDLNDTTAYYIPKRASREHAPDDRVGRHARALVNRPPAAAFRGRAVSTSQIKPRQVTASECDELRPTDAAAAAPLPFDAALWRRRRTRQPRH
jgi:hypothetical protein